MGNCTKFAYFTPDDQYYQNVIHCYNEIFQSEIEKQRCFQLLVAGNLYELFYYMITSDKLQIFDVDAQGKKYRALRRITDYINENFCENISLDSVADETGLSRYYVSHLFKELMNTTFINYLNELRLSRAALLLKTTDTPVIEIAGKSGFNNISNFNRAFKMFHGTTPSKYRKTEKSFTSL
jgi:AraC-like DNA-binding protein